MTIQPRIPATATTICVGSSATDKQNLDTWLRKGETTIRLNQQHSDAILTWSQANSLPNLTNPADGIFTDQKNGSLLIKSADCVPILLLHEPVKVAEHPIIGAVHAGRVGTESHILAKALLHLVKTWGEGTTHIWLGPHICERCYEIDPQAHTLYNLREKLQKQVEITLHDMNYFLSVSEHCTFHDEQDWYSYRREGKGVQMNWTGIRIGSNA